MSNQPVKILLIEDNPGDVRIVQEMLVDARAGTALFNFDLTHIGRLDQAQALLDEQEFDLILVDLSLSDSHGLETVHQVIETAPNLPVIVMSGLEDEALAIDAVQAGAQDYLVKGFVDSYSLVRAIRYAQERKRSEQALRRSELFNRAVLSSVTAHIAVLDHTGKIIAVNEAWEQFARQNGDTLLAHTGTGMNYLEVCRQAAKEDSAGAQQALDGIQAVLKGIQNKFVFEYPCHSPTEERWFLMLVTPMLDEQGGVVVVHENITERIQTEQEVNRRNRELALFNRIIAASAAGLEPEAILETACRELAEIFDIPQVTATLLDSEKNAAVVTAEYRAKGVPSFLGVSIPLAEYPILQSLLENKGPLVITDAQNDPRLAPVQELLRQFGTKSLLIVPLRIKGEIAGSLSLEAQEIRTFSTDEINLAWSVADQVSGAVARVQLDQERRLLSAVVEQTAESVIVTDTNGTILYVNPAFEQITGYSRDEVIGQNPNILESGQHAPDYFQEMWSTIKAGKVWQGRLINKRKDSTIYTEDATITPVRDENGNIVNFVSVQRDITQEIRREEQLRQSQKMEAVGRLAGGVAHDFNNLLTVISGYAELLLYRYSDTGDPIYQDIEQIKKASDRASALTRQLLAFSRKQVVRPKLLNLNDILVDIDKMLQRLIGEDIELVSKASQNLWPIKADPSQIEQIIVNLAVNARDAMPHGGQLTIETDNVELDKEYTRQHVGVEMGRYVLLAVSDTGVGMDEETRANIFVPFFTTKSKDEGTGLGLATVYGIVKQSGGHIWVYSEPGPGTVFKIYLPRAEKEDEMSHPDQAPMAAQTDGGETILLVEDEIMVRELARRVLQKYGYTVLVARNGPEALEIVEGYQNTIHLLLTDVVMPGGLSGRQLASQLSAQYPEMKILYMSGYTGSAVVRHGVLEADVWFLQKPFTPDGLINKIREVLNIDTPSSL